MVVVTVMRSAVVWRKVSSTQDQALRTANHQATLGLWRQKKLYMILY